MKNTASGDRFHQQDHRSSCQELITKICVLCTKTRWTLEYTPMYNAGYPPRTKPLTITTTSKRIHIFESSMHVLHARNPDTNPRPHQPNNGHNKNDTASWSKRIEPDFARPSLLPSSTLAQAGLFVVDIPVVVPVQGPTGQPNPPPLHPSNSNP